MFLSVRASDDQSDLVFSGVFSIVWIGEAVVTLQIKLLGGNMYVPPSLTLPSETSH
jgi:protein YIPF6